MRTLVLLAILGLVAACERSTDRISPCFGRGGRPAVGRAAWQPSAPLPHASACDFVPVGE